MLENKEEFARIIAEQGAPEYVYMGEGTNFGYLEWKDDPFLLCCSKHLINFAKDYYQLKVNSIPVYLKLDIYQKPKIHLERGT